VKYWGDIMQEMGDRSLGVMETLGDITPNTEAEV